MKQNRKLRAKQGRLKARIEFGTLHPDHGRGSKSLKRMATNERIALERQTLVNLGKKLGFNLRAFRMEEAESLDTLRVLPSVEAIYMLMSKNKYSRSMFLSAA